jgi:hypothetical protein
LAFRQALLRLCFDFHRLDVRPLPKVLTHALLRRAKQCILLDLVADYDAEVDAHPLSIDLMWLLNGKKPRDHLEVFGDRFRVYGMTNGLHPDAIGSHAVPPSPGRGIIRPWPDAKSLLRLGLTTLNQQ